MLADLLKDELPKGKFWNKAWSLIDGCTPVSPGCKNCWLAQIEYRFRGPGSVKSRGLVDVNGTFNKKIVMREDRLKIPLNKKPTVYAIWSDLGHESVEGGFRALVHNIMSRCPQHYFIIVTKHPEIYGKNTFEPLPNVFILITMEDQERFQDRLPYAIDLAQLGLKVGVLCEPMLSPIRTHSQTMNGDWLKFFKWVVCGPENGPGKRPFDHQWAIDLQQQSEIVGVPFFFKGGLLDGKEYFGVPEI